MCLLFVCYKDDYLRNVWVCVSKYFLCLLKSFLNIFFIFSKSYGVYDIVKILVYKIIMKFINKYWFVVVIDYCSVRRVRSNVELFSYVFCEVFLLFKVVLSDIV